MQKLMKERLRELERRQKRRRQMGIIAAFFGVIIIGGVVWGMTQPGVAMTGDPVCGLKEHKHSDKCYEDVLVCEEKESEGHKHDDSCYKTEEVLVCDKEEVEANPEEGIEGHKHDKDCYEEKKELVCKEEESKGHTHSDKCYKKELVCKKEEHTHDEDCYIDKKADVEKKSDWNKQYKGTNWKGAWGDDLVKAASKQKGYKESSKNYKKVNGEHKGYTRYGEFSGKPYTDWDAAFVNFCLHYAGAAKSGAFPSSVNTNKWYNKFNKANGSFLAAPDGYDPKKGDIVFFEKKKGETDFTMGIVSSASGGSIKVIEGNVDNGVKEQKYSTGDGQIFAYIKVTELEQAFKGTAEEEKAEEEKTEEKAEEESTEETEAADSEEENKEENAEEAETADTEEGNAEEAGTADTEEENTEGIETADAEGENAEGIETADSEEENAEEKDPESVAATEEMQEEAEDSRFMQEAETENYIVTVRYGHDAGLHQGAKLKVIEYAPDTAEYKEKAAEMESSPEWVLDIGFYEDGEEVEPRSEVSIEVKSKNKKENETAESEYDIIHFGKDRTETLESTEQKDENGDPVIGFTAESFSVFSKAPSKPEGATTYGDSDAGSVTTTIPEENEKIGAWLLGEGNEGNRNNWQIVKEGFEGNTSAQKTRTSNDGMVRLQKNVVPTDVENEFLVYLSMDINSWWEDFFENATYMATEQNKWHSYPIGTIQENVAGAKDIQISTKPVDGWPHNVFKIVRKVNGEKETLAEVELYYSKAENFTIFIPLSTQGKGSYLLLGVDLSKNPGELREVLLDDTVIDQILSLVNHYSVNLKTVTDTMGDYIEFQEVVQPKYEEGSENPSENPVKIVKNENGTTTINWTINYQSSPKDGWETNIAELVYRVKLDVNKVGFNSCADKFDIPAGTEENPLDGEGSVNYKVNESATLNYDYITEKNNAVISSVNKNVDFQKPYVRGLLYNCSFTKKGWYDDAGKGADDNDAVAWVLPGAEFKLEKLNAAGNAVDSEFEAQIGRSDDNGEIKIISSKNLWGTNLEWGTYRVTEIKTPDGYESPKSGEELKFDITLCYTTNPGDVIHDTEYEYPPKSGIYPNMKNVETVTGEGGTSQKVDMVVYNKAKRTKLTVQKHWEDNNNPDRPKEIQVKLIGSVEVVDKETQETTTRDLTSDEYVKLKVSGEQEQTLSGSNWSHTWNNLPTKNIDGKDITWRIEEIDVQNDYQVSYPGYDYQETQSGEGGELETLPAKQNDGSSMISGTTGTDSEEITPVYHIVNILKKEWKIVKKSTSSTDANPVLLEGAVFTLTATPPNIKDNEDGSFTGISGEDGVIVWYRGIGDNREETPMTASEINKLKGTYVLKEEIAPSGYSCSDEEWTITFGNSFPPSITTNKPIKNSDGELINTINAVEKTEDGSTVYVFTFNDEPLYELPSTGGKGVYLYMFGGLLLMAGGLLMTYKNRRRGVLES